ncbi:MAG: methyltransferase domain-containing protein, partial [Anaerolineales bacterium]|nr:methyltransferase domain-containing protein [Anaerolineales bacterium]
MSRGRRISRVKLIPPSEETADRYLLECDHKRLYQSPESFPKLTAKEIFNAGGPISLDIGCGTGEFLLATAETHPEEFFLGIEISRRAIYHAVHLAEKRKLANLKFLKADFALLYPLIPEKSLNRVYLNFPDPNYGGAKKRKQRIFSPRFLDLMAAALNKDGRIQVVT